MTVSASPNISRLIDQGKALVEAARATVAKHHISLGEGHQYWKGIPVGWPSTSELVGQAILGVTETLHKVGIIDDRWFAKEHAERGTWVHRYARDAVNTVPPMPWTWPRYEGYGRSLRAWWDEKQPTTLATEFLVYHQTLDYAGTTDWVGIYEDALWAIDWKSGSEAAWHSVQLSAYTEALCAGTRHRVRRGVIYLSADGTPAKVRACYRPGDRAVFQAALLIARFREGQR